MWYRSNTAVIWHMHDIRPSRTREKTPLDTSKHHF
jgi:hypothetical protein